jgi:regulator of sigma D
LGPTQNCSDWKSQNDKDAGERAASPDGNKKIDGSEWEVAEETRGLVDLWSRGTFKIFENIVKYKREKKGNEKLQEN